MKRIIFTKLAEYPLAWSFERGDIRKCLLHEVVPEKKDTSELKLLIARLYNAGVCAKKLIENSNNSCVVRMHMPDNNTDSHGC